MLSVVIITKNEADNIEQCLQSVQWADEIILVDSGSTDATLCKAQRYTSLIYHADDWHGYGIQKQRALSYATCDWVLNIDADEIVTPELTHAILDIMQNTQVDACRIPIRMQFYNQKLRYSLSPTRHIRLFKRSGAAYSQDPVHEKIQLPASARVISLTAEIQHNSYIDVSHALEKINRYSSATALLRQQAGRRTSLLRICSATLWMFIRTYFIQFGFLDGRAGFLLAIFNTHGTFYRGIKQLYPDRGL